MYKIVIVEDELLIRKWLTSYIENQRNDFSVVGTASNGKLGAEIIEYERPDIVLTDISMPVMDAFDMFNHTQHLSYLKIILSAYNDFDNAKRAMHFQVFDFLAKPINVDELNDVLNRSVDFLFENQKQTINQIISIPAAGTYSETIESSIYWIKQHINDSIRVPDIANAVAVSESHLYKIFKEETQMTINEFIGKLKVNKAIELIYQNPSMKIYELADLLGYTDEKYFSKLFKKHSNVSIGELKAKIYSEFRE